MASRIDTLNKNEILKEYEKKVTPQIKKVKENPFKKYRHESKIFEDTSIPIQTREKAFNIKQKEMRAGAIAQICLGNFIGYTDLCRGHVTGLDIIKNDNTIIGEIKNNYNTMNSSSKKGVCDKLAKYKKNNPDTLCFIGIINPKPKQKCLRNKIIHNGVELEMIYGDELFKMIFTYKGYNFANECIEICKNLYYTNLD